MNSLERFGCKRKQFINLINILRLQYSIYAGRHVVPGIEGLLIECTTDKKSMWGALSVPLWSSTAQLITKYLVSMIQVCFISNNGGDYSIRGLVSTNVFAHLPDGDLRNHEYFKNSLAIIYFPYYHITEHT